jgi:Acetoacetate decarboxylase (ADC)
MTGTPYISWLGHGEANIAPPGIFTGAKAHSFVFEANKAAMQKTVDTLLNPAGAGQVSYDVAVGYGFVSFMDIAKCWSGTDPSGWLPGRETAFWIPLIEKHANPLDDRLVFWAPYIFINYPIGMVVGRETWGWPKTIGDISVAADNPSAPMQFGCVTGYFPKLSSDVRGETGMLFQVTQSTPGSAETSVWDSAEDAIAGLIGGTLGGLAMHLAKALHIQPEVPCVALQQYRMPGATQMACYQAITHSPIGVDAFTGGGPLSGDFSIEITTCESHQIVQDFLGTAPSPGSTKIPVSFAAWIDMDFRTLPGGTVVVAS